MCKSFEVSITTYIVTLSATVLVWNLTTLPAYRFVALVLFVSGHMQLLDAIVWKSIEYKHDGLNHFVTRYLFLCVLVLELLVSYYGIRYYFGWSNRAYEILMWVAIAAMAYRWMQRCNETGTHSDGYLFWCNDLTDWYIQLAFLFFLVFPIIAGYPNILLKWVVLAAVIGTFVINFMKTTFGTRWCWSSNILSVILLAFLLHQKYVSKSA